MNARCRAFTKPAPPGWTPKPGDQVYTRPRMEPRTILNMVAAAKVLRVDGAFVLVEVWYGYGDGMNQKTWKIPVGLDDVRPIPARAQAETA